MPHLEADDGSGDDNGPHTAPYLRDVECEHGQLCPISKRAVVIPGRVRTAIDLVCGTAGIDIRDSKRGFCGPCFQHGALGFVTKPSVYAVSSFRPQTTSDNKT